VKYISTFQAAHSEKSDVYKVQQGSIPKSALLCSDYQVATAGTKAVGSEGW